VSLFGERGKCAVHLGSSDASRGVDHVAELEPVELARRANRICPHVIKAEPVPDPKRARQCRLGRDTINGIAGRAPHTAENLGFGGRDMKRSVERQYIWMNDLMIEEDAVERPIHPIIDVVCEYRENVNSINSRQNGTDT
jgi:hypothetical protein